LVAELRREIEDQMVTGDGIGEHFLGVLNQPGTQTQDAPGAGQSNFDVLRMAKTKVELNARTSPTAVVLNPNDNETLDLVKVNDEANRFVANPYTSAQPPLWGMTRVVTDAVPAGTAIVGDWTRAVLFDRNQTNILLGTSGDDFLRNLLRALAESRAAFSLTRPAAFTIVSLD
jgi:HK97 family phage major capsid protein